MIYFEPFLANFFSHDDECFVLLLGILLDNSFKFAWRSNFSNSNLQQKETRILETCIRLDTSFCPETRIEIDTRNRKLVFFTFVSPISRSLTSFGIQKTPKLVFCVTYIYKEWPNGIKSSWRQNPSKNSRIQLENKKETGLLIPLSQTLYSLFLSNKTTKLMESDLIGNHEECLWDSCA